MADLYADFVFAALTSALDASSTSVAVDDVSQFPTLSPDAVLTLTIGSSLVHPPTFEIVTVVSINKTALTLTVLRGQEGTTAQAHDTGTLVKGTVTAEMLYRLRSGEPRTQLNTFDSFSERPGDVLTDVRNGTRYRVNALSGPFATDFPVGLSTGLAPVRLAQSELTMPWIAARGTFAGDVGSSGINIAALDSSNMAVVLLDMGANDYSFAATVLPYTDNTVTRGFVLCASKTDGTDGVYVNVIGGAAVNLTTASGTMLATLSTGLANTDTSHTIDIRCVVKDGHLYTWVDLLNSGVFEFHDTDLGAAGIAPYAPYAGLQGNHVDPAPSSGANGVFFQPQASIPVSPYAPVNYGTGSAYIGQNSGDDPNQVHYSGLPWLREPDNAIGVFGVTTPTGSTAQGISYTSGAVNDMALLLWAQGGGNIFDETVTVSVPTDASSDYGLWLRGTADGQTGLYLQFLTSNGGLGGFGGGGGGGTTYQGNLRLIVNGQDAAGLGFIFTLSTHVDPIDDAYTNPSFTVRVVIENDFVVVYDAATGAVLSGALLAAPNNIDGSLITGDSFGLMLRNSNAVADTTLSVRQLIFNDMGLPAGVTAEPQPGRTGIGPPVRYAPVGTMYVDQYDGSAYVSNGHGTDGTPAWVHLDFFTIYTDFETLTLNGAWTSTTEVAAKIDNYSQRVYLAGTVTGGDADTPILVTPIPAFTDTGPNENLLATSYYTPSPMYWPVVHITSGGNRVIRVVEMDFSTGNLTSPDYVSGDTIYLDSISWPRP